MPSKALEGGQQAPVPRALKEAAVTGLLAAALFLPLVAFTTAPDMHNTLQLETRWGLFFSIVAIVTGLRFLQILFVVPWLERRRPAEAAPPSAPVTAMRRIITRWFAPAGLAFLATYPVIVLGL